MTPATQTSAARTPVNFRSQDQQTRGGGVSGGGTPTLSPGDFPDIREPAHPVRLTYRPGVSRVAVNDLHDPTVREVVQALCRDLGADPVDLQVAKGDSRTAWALLDRIDAETGGYALQRVCKVEGLSMHWLRMGLSDLIASGWIRTAAYPPPPPN
jgi:hypothetical protein